ncbi:MAG: AmmeMemoRadiSam system protein B [Acidobacteriota bacterium]|nr:AmmeMemoRadiSam system protein B [Acidobacteriota bacterium]
MAIRAAAFSGSWYPGIAAALAHDVDEYVAAASDGPAGRIRAIVAPHAGLMFSGAVGAHAYKAAAREHFDVAVLVGPSHVAAFEGAALWPEGGFDCPLGLVPVDETGARALAAFPVVHALPAAHRREHSLEMQLPFLKTLLPQLPIVPILIGHQTRATIEALGRAIGSAFDGRRALLVASTDLSHYFPAEIAATLDARVQQCVERFDPEALLELFEEYPPGERGRYVACGGGAAIAVMMAARALGATGGRVLKYAHSGEISGDYNGVVGYMAAAFGSFDTGLKADGRSEG